MVPQHETSDIPQSSRIGSPMAAKYSSSSMAMGAAPETSQRAWSSPSRARTGARTSSSARLHSVSSAGSGPAPSPRIAACSARTRRSPQSRAQRIAVRRSSSAVVTAASRAACIRSHTRGTAPQTVGRTSGRAAATARGSGMLVISTAKVIPV